MEESLQDIYGIFIHALLGRRMNRAEGLPRVALRISWQYRRSPVAETGAVLPSSRLVGQIAAFAELISFPGFAG
jgi:hypothetical protein